MNYLIVCNTGSDSISKINLIENLNEEIISEEFILSKLYRPLGPNGIYIDNNIAYIANNYNNSISIFDINLGIEKSILYIGAQPNDIVSFDKYLYVVCSESNTVVVYDIEENKTLLDIKLNNWPYNIDISKDLNLIFVTNFQSNSISIIDAVSNKVIKELEALEYPTKIRVSEDNKYLYVCESYMGDEKNGYVEVFDLNTFISIEKIMVGRVPIDMYEDNNIIYVCNLVDGSISLINKNNLSKILDINIGGMPRSIVKYGDIAYIGDYLNGRVVCIDLNNNKTKAITVGKEPNAMTLY